MMKDFPSTISATISKSSSAVEARAIKRMTATYKMVKARLLSLYQMIEEDKPVSIYAYNRYYEIMAQIKADLREMGNKDEEDLQQSLIDAYDRTSHLLDLRFPPLPHAREAVDVVSRYWAPDRKLFSDRIWDEMDKLYLHLEQGFIDTISLGRSSKDLASEIAMQFNVSGFQARRLCRTEMAHIITQATLDRYNDAGIKRV